MPCSGICSFIECHCLGEGSEELPEKDEANVQSIPIEDIIEQPSEESGLYTHAVDALHNFLGKPSYPFMAQPIQLYPYILLFRDEEKDTKVSDENSIKQLKNVQLSVMVKDANLIHPKFTEFTRIYCKLWVGKGPKQVTSSKSISEDLFWNETFIFDVENYELDAFHVEIWSSRPGFFEKISRLDVNVDKDPLSSETTQYLLGDSVEQVKDLPCVGQDMSWTIKKGSKNFRGQIIVFIQLGTRKAEDFLLHFCINMEFLKFCYGKQLPALQPSALWKNWLEILPQTALSLIHQHAIQHGITPVEQCICSWIVTSSLKKSQEDRISFYLLKVLLVDIIFNISDDCIKYLKKAFLYDSLTDFCDFVLTILDDLHKNFDTENLELADELYYMLRCMGAAEMKVCYNYTDACKIIEDEAYRWYQLVIDGHKNKLEEGAGSIQRMESLEYITKVYLKNQVVLDSIFMRAFLRMEKYSAWFGEDMVLEWFILCDLYTQPYIKRALQADGLEKLGPTIFHGTSVPDVISVIDEMVIDVWLKMKSQDQFNTHVALIEAIKSCVLGYATAVSERIQMNDFQHEEQAFQVDGKICVVLSNLYAIYDHLLKTKKKIRCGLKDEEVTVMDLLLEVETAMQNDISNIYLFFLNAVRKRINMLIMQAVKSKEEIFQSLVTAELCIYIENTLEMMYMSLKFEAFHIIVRAMWAIVIISLQTGLKYCEGWFITQKSKLQRYRKILHILKQLRSIFYCDGHGLSLNGTENNIYQNLKTKLEMEISNASQKKKNIQ